MVRFGRALVGLLWVATSAAGGDLVAPRSVVESEAAVFQRDGAPAEVVLRGNGATIQARGEAVLAPGLYTVRPAEGRSLRDLFLPRLLRVRPLPPALPPGAPLAERIACVQVHRWDGGQTALGRFLNGLGRTAGSLLVPPQYRFAWILSGPQTTRANVRGAIDALASRGYVVDVFSAVHGYPIQLADGEWAPDHPGLASVRLFYTTACWGAQGQAAFRAAGVRTYVASQGVNLVSGFHLAAFSRGWAAEETVADAAARGWRVTRGAGDSVLLRWLVRRATGLPPGADLTRTWADTEPLVFGDPTVRILSDPRPAPSPAAVPAAVGIVGAIERR